MEISTLSLLGEVPRTNPARPANANAGVASPTPTAAAEANQSVLLAAYDRGRAAFPQLDLSPEVFARHLAGIAAGMSQPLALPDLAIADLFLACACTHGVPGAMAAFHRSFGPVITAAVRQLAGRAATEGELRQDFLEDLLVGEAGHPPIIARYRGEGSLAAWLTVAAHRRGVSHLRAEQAEGRARMGAGALSFPDPSPEHLYCQRRYRAAFEQAIADAALALEPRARRVLGLYWVRGLGLREIGARHGVTKSTASRWVLDARACLVEQTRRLFRQRLGITDDDLMALADELSGDIDVSLSRLLPTSDETLAAAVAQDARADLAQSAPAGKLGQPDAAASWRACAASAA